MNSQHLLVPDYNGRRIRTVVIDGEPWFAAADVTAVLGIRNTTQAVTTLDADERRTLRKTEATLLVEQPHFNIGCSLADLFPGSRAQLVLVSESGLYALTMQSRKPEARPFQRWVTKTVIPTIRKHGGYILGTEHLSPERQAVYHEATRQLGISAAEEREARAEVFALMKPGRRVTAAQRHRALVNRRNNAAMQIIGGN